MNVGNQTTSARITNAIIELGFSSDENFLTQSNPGINSHGRQCAAQVVCGEPGRKKCSLVINVETKNGTKIKNNNCEPSNKPDKEIAPFLPNHLSANGRKIIKVAPAKIKCKIMLIFRISNDQTRGSKKLAKAKWK